MKKPEAGLTGIDVVNQAAEEVSVGYDPKFPGKVIERLES